MVELDRRALLVRGGLASGLAATGAIIAGCSDPNAANSGVTAPGAGAGAAAERTGASMMQWCLSMVTTKPALPLTPMRC